MWSQWFFTIEFWHKFNTKWWQWNIMTFLPQICKNDMQCYSHLIPVLLQLLHYSKYSLDAKTDPNSWNWFWTKHSYKVVVSPPSSNWTDLVAKIFSNHLNLRDKIAFIDNKENNIKKSQVEKKREHVSDQWPTFGICNQDKCNTQLWIGMGVIPRILYIFQVNLNTKSNISKFQSISQARM